MRRTDGTLAAPAHRRVGFVIVMAAAGLITSPAVLLAVPASVLVGFAFGAGGLAITTFL
jgi:lipooligosaccharide transport system permease protein